MCLSRFVNQYSKIDNLNLYFLLYLQQIENSREWLCEEMQFCRISVDLNYWLPSIERDFEVIDIEADQWADWIWESCVQIDMWMTCVKWNLRSPFGFLVLKKLWKNAEKSRHGVKKCSFLWVSISENYQILLWVFRDLERYLGTILMWISNFDYFEFQLNFELYTFLWSIAMVSFMKQVLTTHSINFVVKH